MTRDQLERLTKSQLLSIAMYYNMGMTGEERKDTIIDKILEVLYPVDEQTEMSARVKRIKEQNND